MAVVGGIIDDGFAATMLGFAELAVVVVADVDVLDVEPRGAED